MIGEKPRPADGAHERVIKMRRRGYDPQSVIEVTLVKRKSHSENYDNGDDVYVDGKHLGSVSPYTGSLDRKAGRLRIPGKRRRLWSSRYAASNRPTFGHVSRAEAIRWMLP